jgi:hypothetical protein
LFFLFFGGPGYSIEVNQWTLPTVGMGGAAEKQKEQKSLERPRL